MAHLARDDEAELLNQAINGLRAGAAKEKKEMSSELNMFAGGGRGGGAKDKRDATPRQAFVSVV